MSNFIRDVFKTQQPDGTFRWDMTNVGFSAVPWILGILVYIALGVYHAINAPAALSLMDYATGFGALFAGGGIGVFAHSKANV